MEAGMSNQLGNKCSVLNEEEKGNAGHESQDHRITESKNSRGWKGPLWVI